MVGSGIFENDDASDDFEFLVVILPNESQKYVLRHRAWQVLDKQPKKN